MPYLTVQGLKARYVDRHPVPGGLAPVVFIHGAGGSHLHWLLQVRAFRQSPSYALDLPGHGHSDGPARDSIRAYGDWLVSFLDEARLDRAVLAGHSMGGAIALDIALRHPARVAGLGLVATGARLRVAPAILEGFRHDPERTVRLVTKWAFGPETSADLVRRGRRQMEAVPVHVFLADFAACDRFDVMTRLGDVTAPVIVVCGTKDVMTPPKYSAYLRDHISGAELCLIEGAGHMVMLEKPAEVVKALAAFVEKL